MKKKRRLSMNRCCSSFRRRLHHHQTIKQNKLNNKQQLETMEERTNNNRGLQEEYELKTEGKETNHKNKELSKNRYQFLRKASSTDISQLAHLDNVKKKDSHQMCWYHQRKQE
jgi:collagenase-like PrtC family protease